MTDRPQLAAAGYRKRYNGGRVAVDNSHDVRPLPVDRTVNEPLQVQTVPARVDRCAIKFKFENVIGSNLNGRHVARQQEVIGPQRVSNADVPKCIDDLLVKKDVVRVHQILDHAENLRIRCFFHAVLSMFIHSTSP